MLTGLSADFAIGVVLGVIVGVYKNYIALWQSISA